VGFSWTKFIITKQHWMQSWILRCTYNRVFRFLSCLYDCGKSKFAKNANRRPKNVFFLQIQH
jgi:hypothetical protein